MIRASAAVLCALALVVAGCGGDDSSGKDDYEKSVTEISQQWQKELQEVGAQVTTSPDRKEIAGVLGDSAKVLDEAGGKVAALEAPGEVKEAHGLLVAGLRELSGAFERAESAATKGDEDAMRKALANIDTSAGSKKIQRADELYRKAGYSISEQQEK